MRLVKRADLIWRQLTSGLPDKCVDEQPAAHPHAAMDSPHRPLNPDRGQGFLPRQHMLVDTVDERAVEIEEEAGAVDLRFDRICLP